MVYSAPVNIVTGFLGSGKTTLLRHVLQNGMLGERVAVLVNEVADLGIDGQVIQGVNVDKIVELSDNCICCSGILQFGLAVQEIFETAKPTMLVVESSGIAEVRPLVAEIRNVGLRTDAVITVVDAGNAATICDERELARDQVREADFLILNKTDLVDDPELTRLERRLRRLNGHAPLFRTRHGALDSDIPFASSVRRFRERAASSADGSSHGDAVEGGFQSFVYKEPGTLSRKRFERFLGKLPGAVYRAKGIVRFAGDSQPSLFNYVCGRWDFEWISLKIDDRFSNQAVFIGERIEGERARVFKRLRSCREE